MLSLLVTVTLVVAVVNFPIPLGRQGQIIKQFAIRGVSPGAACFRLWQTGPAWGCPFCCTCAR